MAISWPTAHLLKYIISVFKKEKYTLKAHLFRSGGMPSSHSATSVSVATLIGLRDGFGSGLFGIAMLFSIIVMYDAMKVRRSAGEQGEAIKALIKENKSATKPPRTAKGHTPLEVVAGCLLGVVLGVVVFITIK